MQSSLVDFYAKIGETRKARLVFDEMSNPNLVPWNGVDFWVFFIRVLL